MATEIKLLMDNYLPLRDVVFLTLRQAILRGDLMPGERLMEIQLANMLGVSRTPVREAIRKLELEGLVLMVPRKGAEVAEITEKDLRDVLEVREALEVLAVQLACKKITAEQITLLREKERAYEEAIQGGDLTQIAETDVQFHDVIYGATNNDKLVVLLNNMREQMYRYRIEYLKNPDVRQSIAQEHTALVETMRSGNSEDAEKIMVGHITNQVLGVRKIIEIKE